MSAFFSVPIRRFALMVESDKWLGTPFRDGWSKPKVGVDCVQLCAAIYSKCGVLKSFSPPPYTIGAWKGIRESPILKWLSTRNEFSDVTGQPSMEGDLLCFAQGRSAYHTGIYLDEGAGLFIHAMSGDGVSKGNMHDPTWSKRHVATFRPQDS